jgi:putative ubiquitin-RnfH superfamily antitoxin RatB of RatAB toxin-antitoxin module
VSDAIVVEVVYPQAHEQIVRRVVLTEGATVQDALAQSGLLQAFPEIEPGGRNKIGIWNKLAKLDARLRDRDRVEIYSPLIADPKEVRRQRAAEGKSMGKGEGAKAQEAEA